MSKLRGMAGTRKRASARQSAAPRSRPRRRSRRRGRGVARLRISLPRRLPRMPELDQRQRDVLGLALLAAGVFMAYVLYGSGGPSASGGRAGHALSVALGWTVGKARVLAPVAVILCGGMLLVRPLMPELRPLRAGAICVFASVTLALAAGTLGISSAPAGRGGEW